MSCTKDYKKNFCPLPWIELSANADSSLRVCCSTHHGGRVLDENGLSTSVCSDLPFAELYNKKTHRDLRLAMIKGEKPSFCNSCYEIEKYGGYSTRQSYFEQFSHLTEDLIKITNEDGSISVENIKIKRVDFALSNICSLKCRMCTPSCSTSLKKEFDDVGLSYYEPEYFRASTLWKMGPSFKLIFEHNCHHVEDILITGGEPFISKEHRDILKMLKEKNLQGNIKLTYHSSLSHLPDDLIDLWKGFKGITIHLSLEGIKETNEYVRFPSKWNEIISNLEKLQSLSDQFNFSLIIYSCVQAINWPRFHELIFFTKFLNSKFPDIPCLPHPIWLETPSEMSILCLPMELRQLGIRKVERVIKHVLLNVNRPLSELEQNCYDLYQAIFKKLLSSPYYESRFDSFRERVTAVVFYRKQNNFVVITEFKKYFLNEREKFIQKENRIKIQTYKANGFSALEKSDYELALQEFRKVRDLDTTDDEACYNIGFSLKMLNRKLEALNFFRETLILNPEHYFATIEVAWDEVDHNNYKNAFRLFKLAVTNEPDFKKGEAKMYLKSCVIDWFCFWRRFNRGI